MTLIIRYGVHPFWVGERGRRALSMYGLGLSYRKIADALGTTRNAVAGFIGRNRWRVTYAMQEDAYDIRIIASLALQELRLREEMDVSVLGAPRARIAIPKVVFGADGAVRARHPGPRLKQWSTPTIELLWWAPMVVEARNGECDWSIIESVDDLPTDRIVVAGEDHEPIIVRRIATQPWFPWKHEGGFYRWDQFDWWRPLNTVNDVQRSPAADGHA